MSQKAPRDMAASVKGRLLQNARIQGEEFQSVLTRYAIERFLYRLSRSPHRESFVVKDVVVPAAQEATFPSMLGVPGASLLTYPRETVIAEKCEAMIDLGLGNSRLKDFYDLWHLASHFDFEGLLLCQAMSATFQRRGTTPTTLPPPALTAAYYEDVDKRRQWEAFVGKSGQPIPAPVSLADCAHLLGVFLLPLLHATRDQVRFQARWHHTSLTWVEAEQV